MGIAYRVDDPPGLSVAVWDGVVTAVDAQRYRADVNGDAAWASGGRVLTDLSTVRPDSLSRDEIDEFAATFERSERARRARWAIVAWAAFAQMSRFAGHVDGAVRSVIVFNEIGMAARWLGVDERAAQHRVVQELRAGMRPGAPSSRFGQRGPTV